MKKDMNQGIFNPYLFILRLCLHLNPFSFYTFNFPVTPHLSWFFCHLSKICISLSNIEYIPFRIPCLVPNGSLYYAFPLSFSIFPFVFEITFIFSSGFSLPWHYLDIVPLEPLETSKETNKSGLSTSPAPSSSATVASTIMAVDPVARAGVESLYKKMDEVTMLLKQLLSQSNK